MDSTQKKVRAYFIEKDSYYSTIKEVEVFPHLIDNATYYKKISEAKRELISDLKYHILMYKECIDSIKAIK